MVGATYMADHTMLIERRALSLHTCSWSIELHHKT